MLRFTNDKSTTQNGLQFARGFALCNGTNWATCKSVVLVTESYCDGANNNARAETLFAECTATVGALCVERYTYSDLYRVLFRNAAGTEYIYSATTVAKHRGWYRTVTKITYAASPLVTVKMWDRSGSIAVTPDAAVAGTPYTGTNWKLGLNPNYGAAWALSGALNRVWVFDNTGDVITDAQCLAMAAVPQSLAEESTKGRGLIATLAAANDHWTNTADSKDAVLTVAGVSTAQSHTDVGTATSVKVLVPVIAAPSDKPDATWDMACALMPETLAIDNGSDTSTPTARWACALGLTATLAAGGAGTPRLGDAFGRGAVFETDRNAPSPLNGYFTIGSGGPVLAGQGTVIAAMRVHGIYQASGIRNICQFGSTNTLKLGVDQTRVLSVGASKMSDGTTAYVPSTPFFYAATCDKTDTYGTIENQTVLKSAVAWNGGNGSRADDFFYLGADSSSTNSINSTVYSFGVFTNYKYAACIADLRTLLMKRHGFRTSNPTSLGVIYGTSRGVYYTYQGNSLPAQLGEAYWAGAEIHNLSVPGSTVATHISGFAGACNDTYLLARVAGRINRWIVLQTGDNERSGSGATYPWDTAANDAAWQTAATNTYTDYTTLIAAAATNYGTRIACTVIPRADLPDTSSFAVRFDGSRRYFNALVVSNSAGAEGVADIAGQAPFIVDTAIGSTTKAIIQSAMIPNKTSPAITGLTLTVSSVGQTITRSAGSWISDGFLSNYVYRFGGLANGANNAPFMVTVTSATVLTVLGPGSTLVAEGPTGSCTATGTNPVVANAYDTWLHLIGQNGDGQGIFAGPIRKALATAGAPGFAADGAGRTVSAFGLGRSRGR